MLQNAYLLAKIGADTAENERNFAENLPKIGNYPPGQLPYGALNPDRAGGLVLRPLPVTERPLASLEQPQRYVRVRRVRKIGKIGKILQIFANCWRTRSRLYRNDTCTVTLSWWEELPTLPWHPCCR